MHQTSGIQRWQLPLQGHSQHEELKHESEAQGTSPEEAREEPPHLRNAAERQEAKGEGGVGYQS